MGHFISINFLPSVKKTNKSNQSDPPRRDTWFLSEQSAHSRQVTYPHQKLAWWARGDIARPLAPTPNGSLAVRFLSFLFWMSKRVVFSALMVRLSQSIPKYPRVSQSIPEYPRVSQSIPDYPRLSQSRVCQAIRDYSDNLRLSETIQDYPRRSQWILEYRRVSPTIPDYSSIPGLSKEEKTGRVEKNILFSDFRRFPSGVNLEKITLCRYAGDLYNLFF